MALLTGALLRPTWLRGITGTGEDTIIDAKIANIEQRMAAWCGWPTASGGTVPTFESSTFVLYLDGPDYNDSRILRLGIWPVASVTSIYADPTWAYSAAYLVASGDYTLDGSEGLVWLGPTSIQGAWPEGRRAIKATVVGGYSSAPAPLKDAVGMQLSHEYRGRDSVGRSAVSAQGKSVQQAPLSLLPEVKEILVSGGFMLARGMVA